MKLKEEEKRELLRIARAAIASELEGNPLSVQKSSCDPLNHPSGVFVTLRAGGELRGCIGYVEPLFPLAQATQEAAVKAATEDPRFMPLSPEELKNIMIEISVLSPLEEVKDVNSIEIGMHGLVVDAGYRRGLLLPQVATEYGWDSRQFLSQTAVKAGLPPDAWKRKEAQLYKFTVEKIDDSLLSSSASDRKSA